MSSMACFNIEIPKKPANKTASEHRRATKPIMAMRWRARFNHSLNELMSLILDALNKDPTRNSKLEKADILEMTVRHLQNLQRQQMALEVTRDPSVLNKYRAGFSECATEVSRYVNKIDGVDTGMKQRLISHLNNCVQALPPSPSSSSAGAFNPSFPFMAMTAFPGQAPLQVHIPAGSASSPAGGVETSVSSCSSSDLNNNRRMESEAKMTPPASASSAFSFNFPSNASLSPMTPSTPSTPSSHFGESFRYNPYKIPASWASRRDVLRSVSPGSSSSSMGSLSPAGSDSIDCESMSDKNSQGESVWRPW